ncbi:hypothetical protein TUM4261_20360 [Shewanella sp. c952]|nr:hypothetical protein TUM4261_20360 [Shewanella sp. c952]
MLTVKNRTKTKLERSTDPNTTPYKGQGVRFALFITLLMFVATLFKDIAIAMVINREGKDGCKC